MATQPFTQPGVNPALFGWAGQNINQPGTQPGTSPLPQVSPVTAAPSGNPAGLANPGSNLKDMIRNAGFLGVQQGQLRNDLIPKFAQLMMGYGGNAAEFFQKLMDLGGPFYQQKQAESFRQGTAENQNAAAQARQGLSAQGYGATPSGAMAGMLGGMAQGGAQSLSQQFLQNLFQNENLQMGGAQGLSQLAALFNPSGLFGPTGPTGTTQGPSGIDQLSGLLKALGIGGSAGPVSFGG